MDFVTAELVARLRGDVHSYQSIAPAVQTPSTPQRGSIVYFPELCRVTGNPPTEDRFVLTFC